VAQLRREAEIYARDETPIRVGSQLMAWDRRPLGAAETGAHLREIGRRFGPERTERSIRGLAHTRGEAFTAGAVQHAGLRLDALRRDGDAVGPAAAAEIRASSASAPLPTDVSTDLSGVTGHDLSGIRIHDDDHAHRAADLLNARAFTAARDVYFGRNEYRPTSQAGKHLLAHEAAHAIQQRDVGRPVDEHARTSSGGDREEDEASHFARFVTGPRSSVPPSLTPSTRTGLVQRAISFTRANDVFNTNPVVAAENGAGFRLASDPPPALQWDTDVTIHGVAGDPFGNFEVGFHQVEREFYVNVYWGAGANRGHRSVRPDAALPRRDATGVGNTWYNDGAPSVAAAYTAAGDVRSPQFDDTPGTQRFPWTNPLPGRTTNSGWFNYADAFVTYLSARDTTLGTGAAAFRHLANVYWNLSAAGSFDATQPVGGRVALSRPGAVNHSRVIAGGSAEFPAMHGGIIANGHDVTTDT
jgi:hypothetical protein